MKIRRFNFAAVLLGLWLTVQISAAPTTAPSTQSDTSDNPDAKRLTFLGDQLTADEAAIDAINKALLQQGYKVAVANDKASDAAEGNQLMDRKGGAPVRWQDFYGRTAKDFIMHDKDSPVYYQVQRPTQFNYVYHANNTQIESAQSDVASIGQKVDKLLERRKELEAEQSALWAKIAFQSIGNRDIPLRPLYRDQLQADPAKFDDNHPEPPTVKALAAGVLYLRTADAAATNLESNLDTDQGACYVALRDALNANFKSLQDSEANFDDAAGDNPAQLKQMADMVAAAKSIVSICTNLTEAYGKAQDAEQANEDTRCQLYRRTMQESLFGFSEAVGRLDDQLQQLSASWNVIPKHGTRSADKVPEIAITPASPGNAPASAAPAPAPQVASSASPAVPAAVAPPGGANPATNYQMPAGRHIDLLKLVDPAKDAVSGTWTMQDGKLVLSKNGQHRSTIEFPYAPPKEYDYRVEFVRTHGDLGMSFVCAGPTGHQFIWNVSGGRTTCAIGIIDGGDMRSARNPTRKTANQWIDDGKVYTTTVKVRVGRVEAYLNDKFITSYDTDYSHLSAGGNPALHDQTAVGVLLVPCSITINSAEIIEVTGQGNVLPHGNGATANAQSNESSAEDDQASQPAVAAVPAVDASASVPANAESRHVDLLKLFDPSKDVVGGVCTVQDGALVISDRRAKLEFPYQPPAEYDYTIKFTRENGDQAVEPILCAGRQQVALCVGGWTNTVVGFRRVDGKDAQENETTRQGNQWVSNNTQHTLVMAVRKDHIQATLDGKLISECKTDGKSFTVPGGEQLRSNNTLGLFVFRATMHIQAVDVVEVAGEGKALR